MATFSERLPGHTGSVKAIALTKDGSKVVSGSDDKSFRVWNAADGKPLLTIPNLPASVDAVAASANNTMAAAGLANGTVKVFNIAITDAEKAELASYQSANAAVGCAGVHTRFNRCFSLVRRTRTSRSGHCHPAGPKTLSGHTGQIYSVAFSPDGKLAATAAADKSARIWDVAKAAQVRSLAVPEKVAYSVAFNPKGDLLATGGDDKLIRYWNVADGKELRKSQGHGASVYAVAFSPDGTQARVGLGRQDDSNLERRRRQRAAQARRTPGRYLCDRVQPGRQAAGVGGLRRKHLRLGSLEQPSHCFTSTSRPTR